MGVHCQAELNSKDPPKVNIVCFLLDFTLFTQGREQVDGLVVLVTDRKGHSHRSLSGNSTSRKTREVASREHSESAISSNSI